MHSSFVPSLPWILPFVLMLLSIAVLPLAAPTFLGTQRRKLGVSALLGLPVLVLYSHERSRERSSTRPRSTFRSSSCSAASSSSPAASSSTATSKPDPSSTPPSSDWARCSPRSSEPPAPPCSSSARSCGPTSERKHVVHTVVFFIFLVSNIGGCLTPLGDPPLFLGYLQGVPFTWTLRLFPHWLLTSALVLAVYYVWDTLAQRHETLAGPPGRPHDGAAHSAWRASVNVLLLLGVLAAVAFLDAPWRELAIVALSVASWLLTDKGLRHANRFTFGPILEVAALFAGIFLTMIPALDYLRAHGAELGVRAPWQFFWATGALSSFLDNAPTYLTFLALGQGLGLSPEVVGVPHTILAAISVGAVFMGANTYIGNGPNFMVRAIAEENGVKMPSFFHYMGYSVSILIPVFVIVTLVFFR